MKRSITHYRMLSGIRSARPNPIAINRAAMEEGWEDGQDATEVEEVEEVEEEIIDEDLLAAEIVEAVRPETSRVKFKAYQFDRDYAFHYIQKRWFQRSLELGEELVLTADHLKMICDEVHEMGRLRERNRRGCSCSLEPR